MAAKLNYYTFESIDSSGTLNLNWLYIHNNFQKLKRAVIEQMYTLKDISYSVQNTFFFSPKKSSSDGECSTAHISSLYKTNCSFISVWVINE